MSFIAYSIFTIFLAFAAAHSVNAAEKSIADDFDVQITVYEFRGQMFVDADFELVPEHHFAVGELFNLDQGLGTPEQVVYGTGETLTFSPMGLEDAYRVKITTSARDLGAIHQDGFESNQGRAIDYDRILWSDDFIFEVN